MHDPFLQLAIAEGFGEALVPALLAPDLDPDEWLACPPEPPTVPPRIAERLRQPDLEARAAAIRRAAREHGLRVLTPADADFPPQLQEAPLRPLVLFVRGEVTALQRRPAAAVVGSRTPTPYGQDAAESLGRALARAGASLWSGLARGVDGIVHSACVAAGVPTIAVLAGGLDAIYPAEHAPLADRIVATGGALLSELPPGQRARRGHFVRRNRILALATDHVVVVEASLTSGALHTARFAAEAGPEVYALPGPWHSERSQGCHRLLAEGAHVIESTDGLLQALGLGTGSAAVSHHLARSADEERVLQAAAGGPRPTDLLARECGLERGAFLRALFRLEQQGTLQRLPGDLWRRLHGSDAAAAAPTNR